VCVVVLAWLKEWQFWIAIMSVFGGIFAVYKYFDSRKTKQFQQEFDNYHKLIERINKPLDSGDTISIQVQQTAIFELRNYARYKELTVKLLEHWRNKEGYEDIVNETLKYLTERNRK